MNSLINGRPEEGVCEEDSSRRSHERSTGMTEEVRQRCLEPFFSTKCDRGTGLGLAMVYGIIQRHGGTINIESELGRGTTFRVCLPIGTAPPDAVAAASQKFDRPLHILVVDDQPILCELLQEYLSHDWHTVETALNGREALEKFQADRFDVVVTDKAMPEMDGDQLAVAIKKLKPKQTIILLTGFGELAHPNGTPSEAVDLVLSKPISLAGLREALVDVITE